MTGRITVTGTVESFDSKWVEMNYHGRRFSLPRSEIPASTTLMRGQNLELEIRNPLVRRPAYTNQ